jgi:hypothetical protein
MWFWLLVGIAIGWIIEWVIDWTFWRPSFLNTSSSGLLSILGQNPLRLEIEAARKKIVAQEEQIRELEHRLAASKAVK